MSEDLPFGRWLQQRRKALDLTQAELARWVGCATVTIHKIEAEERRPSKEIVERLVEVLRVTEEERARFLAFARGDSAAALPALPAHALPPVPTLKRQERIPDLPAPVTPLIGREQDVAAVCGMLRRPTVRLVTLTGPGGIGKTRLGLQVAAEALADFADGVWFVPLASITDPALVTMAVAQALGLQESGSQSLLDSLKRYLRTKQMLLVLDNFEQVLVAAPHIAELLSAAPQLKVLVTSRAVLRLHGEHEFPVATLPVPHHQHVPSAETLSQYPAAALFVQCAAAAKPDFRVTDANAPAIAEICRRLDGLPLAIELAAARIKLLSPETLLARLSSRLTLLTGGARDAPTRQQTLRATLDWSYHLLDPAEQRLFRRLSVFVGGCTLEAVEAVCGGMETGDWRLETGNEREGFSLQPLAPSPIDVLDGVTSLLDKSMLRQQADAGSEPRLFMLETTREYGLERLEASGEARSIQDKHASYYLALAEQAESELTGAEHRVWLIRLEREHDNLRAALAWALHHRETETALRLAGALWRFWLVRGYLSEGRRWLEAALAGAGSAPASIRAKVLNGAGLLASYQGDYGQAATLCGQSLALYRQLEDKRGIAAALYGLARVARMGGKQAAARAMYEQSLALYRDTGDTPGVANALHYLGVTLGWHGDYMQARAPVEEAVARFRACGNPHGAADALYTLAFFALGHGDCMTARRGFEQALALASELGDRRCIARTLSGLGEVARIEEDYAAAHSLHEESLMMFMELGDRWYIAGCLVELASLAVAQRQPTQATQLCGAAAVLFESIGAPLAAYHHAIFEQTLATARGQVSEETFTTVWAQGRAMSLEQAVGLVEQIPASQPENMEARSATSTPTDSAHSAGLTLREVEVLRLVAQGLTDAQVAEQLVISPRTVHRHLSSIYGKLQVKTRTAAARLAVDQGLV